jgi:methylglutaconyl-CoA hydratase
MGAIRSGAGKRPYGTFASVSETVLRLERRANGVADVRLDRPAVRNALHAELIAALRDAFVTLAHDDAVRVIVLGGNGPCFCAGADIAAMRDSLERSTAENIRDAERMSDMFRAIDTCPKPVIGRVHGAALGGGAGLAAVSDIVVASSEAIFGFTETKLGIIPAVISPFVLAKIGPSAARALFLSGERFDAERAQRIGLVHDIVPFHHLDARIEALELEFGTAGPAAVAAAKRLIADVATSTDDRQTRELTTQAIAAQRITPEGQEGLRAFLERRVAQWVAK